MLIFCPTGASTIHGCEFDPHDVELVIWIGLVDASTTQERLSSATSENVYM